MTSNSGLLLKTTSESTRVPFMLLHHTVYLRRSEVKVFWSPQRLVKGSQLTLLVLLPDKTLINENINEDGAVWTTVPFFKDRF